MKFKTIKLCILLVLVFLLIGCNNSKKVQFIYEDEIIYETTEDDIESVKDFNTIEKLRNVQKEGYTLTKWVIFKQTKTEIIYVPNFEIKTFNVKFYALDEIVKEEIVKYGYDATAPEVQEKEGYTFDGWDKDFTNIKSDLEVNAVFKKVYNIKFYNQEELIKEETVTEGESVTCPQVEKKGYKFIGWDKDLTNIKSHLEVHAQFEIIEYTLTYKDEQGKVLELEPSSYNINSDTSINLPAPPEKEGYEFIGWFENGNRVVTFFSQDAENKVFIAKYKEVEKEKELVLPDDGTFMFTNIKKIPHSSGNGTYVYQPDFTGLDVPSTSVTKWTWTSLDETIAKISQWSSITVVSTGYAILKAVYNDDKTVIGYAVIKTTPNGVFISTVEEANKKEFFKVTFIDKDGNNIEVKEVEKGKTVDYPVPPIVKGYCFIGWSAENFDIESDTTIQANYIKGDFSFSGKTVSILGDSISTYKGYIPDGYAAFYPYPTADFGDVNQTWWMRVINNLGMQLLKNNSYSGSCVATGTGSSGTTNDARLKELLDGNIKPDVIIIYMGANDCASASVSLSTFKSSYKTMIDKIKSLSKESEIYVMTLPSTKLYSESDKNKYNEVIREQASSNNLNLIEMEQTFTKDNYKDFVVDSCHPNKAGMIKISEDVIRAMLKIKGIELDNK